MLRVSDIKDRVRQNLRDKTEPYRWTDTDLLGCIRSALNDTYRKNRAAFWESEPSSTTISQRILEAGDSDTIPIQPEWEWHIVNLASRQAERVNEPGARDGKFSDVVTETMRTEGP